MSKHLAKLYASLPPIDIPALLARAKAKRGGKGHQITRAQRAKQIANRKRNAKLRLDRNARALGERALRDLTAANPHQPDARQRVLIAMVPGEWMGEPDARRRAGVKRKSCAALLGKVYLDAGLVEKAINDEWRSEMNVQRFAGCREPKTLYRLTPAGEAVRAGLLAGEYVKAGDEQEYGGERPPCRPAKRGRPRGGFREYVAQKKASLSAGG